MADENGLKMPDEYTEFTYGDGELSGSGHRRWSEEDTWTVAKYGLGALAVIGIGTGIYYRRKLGNVIV
jgi:hypothetical protein